MIRIDKVKKRSIADKIGLKKGMHLISIDDKEINDPLDLKFFEIGESIRIKILDKKETHIYDIKKGEEEPIGIESKEFEIRLCENNCIFCFVDQNPPLARESLLIKDDDYRMSFLYGNYLSLTNFKEEDFKRIIEMKLSPLYISVHTTNPRKRIEMMRNKKAGEIMAQLKRLCDGGIKLHTQIVLLPGVNDGEILNETLEDLLSLDLLESIGIVPVGLTSFRSNLPEIKNPTPKWMEGVIRLVEPYQEELVRKKKKRIIYLADEFYIKTNNPIPPLSFYDDFPQLENGIGLTRKFLDGLELLDVPLFDGEVLLVTGILAYESVQKLEFRFKEAGVKAEVVSFKNRYFGETVEVAPLLGGWDLLGLLYNYQAEFVILPPDIVNDEGLFIDGCSLSILENNLKKKIIVAPYDVVQLGNLR
ncbi:MAG: DUF512 domain-containing protein [candidate division WOR-3 bacterium]